MVRTKEAPVRANVDLVPLRVRHAGGQATVEYGTATTLTELRGAIEAAVGGPVHSVAFHGAAGPVALVADGNFAVDAHTRVATLGLSPNDCVNVSLAPAAPGARPPAKRAKKAAPAASRKKRKAQSADDSDGDESYAGESDEDAEARAALGPLATAALAGGARAGDDAATVAAAFVSAHDAPESMLGCASGMYVSQLGASRERAASGGAVTLKRVGAKARVAWRATKRAAEKEEVVRLFTTDESIAVVAAILRRQSGSARRRLAAAAAPSTRLLTPDSIATRCPALFWSLYANSRCADDADDAKGDVPFALEHVLTAALAIHKAEADAERAFRGDS